MSQSDTHFLSLVLSLFIFFLIDNDNDNGNDDNNDIVLSSKRLQMFALNSQTTHRRIISWQYALINM